MLRNTLRLLPALITLIFAGTSATHADELVILATNDTHSLIEPDKNGAGGVLQRKAIIDSVRRAERHTLLVDAGDMVQGTLYFKFFRGDVEFPLADMMGYDVQTLGNHEFDNGIDELAKHYKSLKSSRISTTYDLDRTPLKGILQPYAIKKVGGKKIGFIAANLDPRGIVATDNYRGLEYIDPIEAVNSTAAFLKKEKGCDLVVVISHLGAVKENDKTTDYELAAASRDVDMILGGHSHVTIKPGENASDHPDRRPGEDKFLPSLVNNADGRPVLVTQAGKYGRYIAEVKIDLDNLDKETPEDFDYSLISVSDRFAEEKLDKRMKAFIEPYKARVDSINRHVIARSLYDLKSDDRTGGYANLGGDFAKWYLTLKADSLREAGLDVPQPDLGLLNVGGIRHDMSKGDVTEGEILETFPFDNRLTLIEVKGSDLLEALQMAARKGGEGVSDDVIVLIDDDNNVKSVLIDETPLDPERLYYVATIDYVANGNDDFTSLKNARKIWTDEGMMDNAMLRYIKHFTDQGRPVAPDPTPRFQPYTAL